MINLVKISTQELEETQACLQEIHQIAGRCSMDVSAAIDMNTFDPSKLRRRMITVRAIADALIHLADEVEKQGNKAKI